VTVCDDGAARSSTFPVVLERTWIDLKIAPSCHQDVMGCVETHFIMKAMRAGTLMEVMLSNRNKKEYELFTRRQWVDT